MKIPLRALLWILLAFSPGAFADFDPGFFSVSNLPVSPQNLSRALEASIQLRSITGNTYSDCSGTITSPDGYVLTAVHCIEDCLETLGAGKMLHTRRREGSVDLFETKSLTAEKKHFCPNTEMREHGLEAPEVIYVGRGYNQWDDKRALSILPEVLARMLNAQDDYAILKFPRASNLPCVPIQKREVALRGAAVWGIGFPGQNYRRRHLGADGESKTITYGHTIADLNENQYYVKRGFSRELIDRNQKIYGLPNEILSDIDLFSGNSGGALIDEEGLLIGENIASAVPSSVDGKSAFVNNSSVSMRLTSIFADLQMALGAEGVNQIFDCPVGFR